MKDNASVLQIRLNAEEHKILKDKSSINHLPMSSYARMLMFNQIRSDEQ